MTATMPGSTLPVRTWLIASVLLDAPIVLLLWLASR